MNRTLAVVVGVASTLCPLGVAHAQPTTPAADPALAEAKRRFDQGVALARAGKCEGALAEFEASYELVARASTLYNIGQCNEELGRYTRAIAAYREYLRIAPADDPERRAVERTIELLGSLLATVRIASNVEAEVWVGDERVGHAPGAILVPGGRHAIELRRDGYVPVRREIEVAGKQSIELELEMSEARTEIKLTRVEHRIEERGLPRHVFWTGVTATALATATGAAFGLHARMVHASAIDKDPRLPRDDELGTIDRSAKIADMLFATAGVLAIGTTAAWFLTDWNEPAVAPVVGDGAVGIAVRGRL